MKKRNEEALVGKRDGAGELWRNHLKKRIEGMLDVVSRRHKVILHLLNHLDLWDLRNFSIVNIIFQTGLENAKTTNSKILC